MNLSVPISPEFSGFDSSKLRPQRGRGRPRKLTPQQELFILKLLEAGYSLSSVGEAFGVCWQTIDQVRQRLSLQQGV